MSNGYNRIAGIYDRLARIVFGNSIIQSQTIFLDQLKGCQSLLVLGGGTGWWLNDLLERFPYLRITFVDSSSEMIRIAASKLDPGHHVEFVCGTIESIHSNQKFDGVILYYFVDLFADKELTLIIQRIIACMNSNSLWLVSDFVNKKSWHSLLLKLMYTFFRYSTGQRSRQLPDWQRKLEEGGIKKINEHSFYGGFIHAGHYSLTRFK